MRRNPQSFYWDWCAHRRLISWIPPYTPASTPIDSWSIAQAALASYPVTLRTHFSMSCRQVSPTPTGLTPGCLSSVISRPLTIAQKAAQRGHPFPSHSAKSSTVSCNFLLAASNRRSQCWRITKSVPAGPAPPDSFLATGTSSSGRSGYVSRLAADGERVFGCLVHSTSITLSWFWYIAPLAVAIPPSPAP